MTSKDGDTNVGKAEGGVPDGALREALRVAIRWIVEGGPEMGWTVDRLGEALASAPPSPPKKAAGDESQGERLPDEGYRRQRALVTLPSPVAAPPAGEALRLLQAIPNEDFYRVYDQCREIQKAAQQVSEFVDRVANLIPDQRTTTGAPAPASLLHRPLFGEQSASALPTACGVEVSTWERRSQMVEKAEGGVPDGALRQMIDAAEMLWVVLANVSGGDWTKQSAEWQEAAARWRDNYFAALKATRATAGAPAPERQECTCEKELREIEAGAAEYPDLVPHYVPRLIAEIRRLRVDEFDQRARAEAAEDKLKARRPVPADEMLTLARAVVSRVYSATPAVRSLARDYLRLAESSEHKRSCPAYGNYQPPYEECDCGDDVAPAKAEGGVPEGALRELQKRIKAIPPHVFPDITGDRQFLALDRVLEALASARDE